MPKTTKYVVALLTGGVMEQPGWDYCNYQVVEATNEKEAEAIYNKVNKCQYYYGECIGKVVEIDGEECMVIPIKKFRTGVTYL